MRKTTPPPMRVTTRAPLLVRRALLVVLVLNATVAVIKVVVGLQTGALTVLGAALESALDMLNNAIGMILVTIAGREPDEDHPYGHDKFETLGALGIVGFLSVSCFELLRTGVVSLMSHGHPMEVGAKDIVILLLTLVVNVIVLVYERRRGRALSSAFLLADSSHTGSDLLVTLLALASLLFAHVGPAWLDAVLAIGVALILAVSGYRILRQSIPILVDERAVASDQLERVACSIPGIEQVRGVRSRWSASGQLFVELAIVVAGTASVDEAHSLADQVESAIEHDYGNSQVTVHIEPA
jgi:cation diffusion facilitator family transporter